METYIEMTMEEWEAAYKPIKNHIDPNASFQDENGEGIMFETYGEELDFVRSQNPLCIWTYHHGDSNSSYIGSGYHVFNRLGYFITEIPFEENQMIDIVVEEPNYLCANCEEQWFDEAADLHYEQFSELGTDGKCAACATPEELKEINYEPTATD